MSKEINDEGRTRYQQRSKRKKTNFILNGLIIVVILLIVFVSYSIFHTNDEKNADKNKDSDTKTGQQASGDKETASSTTGSDNTDENTTTEEEEEEESEDGEVVTEGGSDSNVIKTIENSSWQPVGTTQTGEHVASYSEGVDWNEQIKALSYATGLDSGNMTLWFLGNNNQDPHKSIGTVSSKDKSEKYRVYIEWVDGSGWKPTKVEEIKDLNIR